MKIIHSLTIRHNILTLLLGVAVQVGLCLPGQAQQTSTGSQVDVLLKTLDKGNSIDDEVINLSDILFEFGSPALDQSTLPYLDKVVVLMSRVPNMTVLIEGHTDNVGAKEYNKSLSQRRAESVRQYLISNRIDSTRIKAEGFGDEQPLASNTTGEGRAQNRRVEITIMKPPTVETLQDLIILANGDTIGAMVILANEEGVRYKGFSSEEEKILAVAEVNMIQYSDGRTWKPSPPIPPTPEEPKENEWADIGRNLDRWLFTPPDYFYNGTSIIGLHGELVNNIIDGKPYDSAMFVPPVSLSFERPLWRNIGIGVNLGITSWGDTLADYRYSYYSLGVRWTYHPKVHDRLDPYIGGAITYRMIRLTEPEVDPQHFLGGSYDWFIGVRYFPTRRFGLFGEFGSDAISKYNVGAVILFGPLAEEWMPKVSN